MVTFVPAFVSQEVLSRDAADKAEQARLAAYFPGQSAIVREQLEAWRTQHPRPRASVARVADPVVHIVQAAGIDHAGIGADFDGMKEGPRGLEASETQFDAPSVSGAPGSR